MLLIYMIKVFPFLDIYPGVGFLHHMVILFLLFQFSIVKVKVTQSCPTLCNPMDCSPWTSPGQNNGVGSLSFLQAIFPTQGWNLGLSHCRQILYQLSHKINPRILEWVAFPFSSGSSKPRDWTQVSCIAGGFFTSWTRYLQLLSLLLKLIPWSLCSVLLCFL